MTTHHAKTRADRVHYRFADIADSPVEMPVNMPPSFC